MFKADRVGTPLIFPRRDIVVAEDLPTVDGDLVDGEWPAYVLNVAALATFDSYQAHWNGAAYQVPANKRLYFGNWFTVPTPPNGDVSGYELMGDIIVSSGPLTIAPYLALIPDDPPTLIGDTEIVTHMHLQLGPHTTKQATDCTQHGFYEQRILFDQNADFLTFPNFVGHYFVGWSLENQSSGAIDLFALAINQQIRAFDKTKRTQYSDPFKS